MGAYGLRMIHNECESDYETLLEMSGKSSIEIERIKKSAVEIFKIVDKKIPIV